MDYKNILIADDSRSLLALYRDIFSGRNKEGFSVETFNDGKYLFEYFSEAYKRGNKLPLCILDMVMPLMDGLETAKNVRTIDSDVIIIIITSFDLSLEVIRENLKKDIYYIKKPFNPEELYCLVDSLVKGWNKNLRLEMKNRELQDAYNELKITQMTMLQKEKLASIGQLAAGVAHEINNPMGFISGNLRALNKYINKFTDFIEIQEELLKSIADSEVLEVLKEKRKKLKLDYIIEDVTELIAESLEGADRVARIVRDLKSFSRVDEAEYKLANINECIESTLNIVWNEIKYKAAVKKEYGDLPHIKCYPQQLNQVFMNLLVNASHAIEKEGEIRIRTWQEGEAIFISISDTGSGIPEENLKKLFEPFFTTKEVGKGTGLGLSITYDIVKQHGGEIIVDSTVGKGTTFTIKLPLVKDVEI